jgi:4-amino-4-deoxy-L-arabinose transferase-like glycosyltransferase
MLKKLIKEYYLAVLLLFGVILIGVFLRFYNLTILPVFADEAIYIRWSQVMRAESTLRFLPMSDGKQPLFMWLTIPLLKLFTNPLFAARALSGLSGLGTSIGIFFLSYQLFKSKKVSVVAALLYIVSPFTVFFDRLALADSLLSMFGVWIIYFSIITVKNKRFDLAMITGFILGGALLTKSTALFYSLLIPTTWYLSDFSKKLKQILNLLFKLITIFVPTYLIGYGIYNILRLGPNFHMIGSRNFDYVYPYSHILTSPLDPFMPFFDRSFEWIRLMGPWPILLLATFGIVFNIKKHFKEILLLSLWFIFPIVVQSEFAKVFTARYIFLTLPYLFILAGSVLLKSEKFIKDFFVVLLLLFIFLSFRFDYQLLNNPEAANLPRSERSGYLEEWTAGTGIKEIADTVRAEYQNEPTKKIIVGTEGYFGTLPDGMQIYLNDLSEITVIGVGLDFEFLPNSLIESKKSGNKTFLVINNDRLNNGIEKLGLNLLAAYPKAVKPDGSRQTLYFFEVTENALKLAK